MDIRNDEEGSQIVRRQQKFHLDIVWGSSDGFVGSSEFIKKMKREFPQYQYSSLTITYRVIAIKEISIQNKEQHPQLQNINGTLGA